MIFRFFKLEITKKKKKKKKKKTKSNYFNKTLNFLDGFRSPKIQISLVKTGFLHFLVEVTVLDIKFMPITIM